MLITYGYNSPGLLTAAAPQNSNSGVGYYCDTYTFVAVPGDRFTIAYTTTSTLQTQVYLIDPNAVQWITKNRDTGIEWICQIAGTWTIQCTSFNPGQIGSYQFALTLVSQATPGLWNEAPIRPDGTFSAAAVSGERNGPFEYGGYVYALLNDPAGYPNSHIRCYGSVLASIRTVPWNQFDAVNAPVCNQNFNATQFGRYIEIAFTTDIAGVLRINHIRFDMLTGTWGTKAVGGEAQRTLPGINSLSTGSVSIIYKETVAGPIKAALVTAGVFGVAVNAAEPVTDSWLIGFCIDVTTNTTHLIYSIVATGLYKHCSLTSSLVLSAITVLNAATPGIVVQEGSLAAWSNTVVFAFRDSTLPGQTITSIFQSNSLTPSSWSRTVIDSVNFDARLVCLFKSSTGRRLYLAWCGVYNVVSSISFNTLVTVDAIFTVYNDGSGWSSVSKFYNSLSNPQVFYALLDPANQFLHGLSCTVLSTGDIGICTTMESAGCDFFYLQPLAPSTPVTVLPLAIAPSSAIPYTVTILPDPQLKCCLRPEAICMQKYEHKFVGKLFVYKTRIK